MLKLISHVKLGMILYTVVYSNCKGEVEWKDFWSEEHARAYASRNFPKVLYRELQLINLEA
ncbi:hypothetical protein KAU11_09175 [Candidatus Babeliales bacterium]|nr:hypothetical protein [Candidatus Babeliales bacterium]